MRSASNARHTSTAPSGCPRAFAPVIAFGATTAAAKTTTKITITKG